MNETTKFDAIEWINNFFQGEVRLDCKKLRPVLCFSLIWNLFETNACSCNASQESIHESVDRADECGSLHRERYNRSLQFFRKRYLDPPGNLDSFFDFLRLTNPEAKEVVRRALKNDTQELKDHVYALLLIAHRIRNNFFHGNKKIKDLPLQVDLFTEVNYLLATYVDDILGK